jgi:hypothetical protein
VASRGSTSNSKSLECGGGQPQSAPSPTSQPPHPFPLPVSESGLRQSNISLKNSTSHRNMLSLQQLRGERQLRRQPIGRYVWRTNSDLICLLVSVDSVDRRWWSPAPPPFRLCLNSVLLVSKRCRAIHHLDSPISIDICHACKRCQEEGSDSILPLKRLPM